MTTELVGLDLPDQVTVREVARHAGVHPNTVGNYIRRGALPAHKMFDAATAPYVIPRREALAFIAEQQAARVDREGESSTAA